MQEAGGLGCPSTSTRHCRQAPTGSSSGWSQNRGIWMPEQLGGADHQRALGHGDLEPVDGDGDSVGWLGQCTAGAAGRLVTVIGPTPGQSRVDAAGSNGQPPCCWCSMYSSRKYLIEDATGPGSHRRPSAQNARPRMLSQMSSSFSRSASLRSVPSPRSSRSQQLDHPVACPPGTACTCRTTRARRTRSSAARPAPRRSSRRRSAAPGCRASTRPRPPTRSRAARRGARR